MTEWKKARKRPVIIEFREPRVPAHDEAMSEILVGVKSEVIHTLEGTMFAIPGRHYVIRGIDGELYSIRKTIFEKTYEVLSEDAT